MPVEVRYHVIREGKEIAVYISKKEADAHDKMLDIAEALVEFINQAETIHIGDDALEELCIYLSKNRDDVVKLLKGGELEPKALKRDTSLKESLESPKSASRNTDIQQQKQIDTAKSSIPATPEKTKRTTTPGPTKKQR